MRRLQKRGVPSGSTAAQSARDQNATEIKCEIKDDSREDERSVNSGVVSEDIEGVMIDSDIEKTGRNEKENIERREDEEEKNVNCEKSIKILKV